jgi:hypothetical protein
MIRTSISIGALCFTLYTVGVAMPVPAVAFQEKLYVFRTMDDPDVQPNLAVCEAAPFEVSIVLGASLWAMRTRSSDGLMVNPDSRRIGTGTACLHVTSLAVDATAPIAGEFVIGSRTVRATGSCLVESNDVPVPGLILANCSLRIDPAPGVLGGIASSNSVFNPRQLPGFNTGSIWTVRLFLN